jgi:hypothetical protein
VQFTSLTNPRCCSMHRRGQSWCPFCVFGNAPNTSLRCYENLKTGFIDYGLKDLTGGTCIKLKWTDKPVAVRAWAPPDCVGTCMCVLEASARRTCFGRTQSWTS